MALSPGAMVNQARNLLSEAEKARDETFEAYNLTMLMMLYASENASIARSMAEAAERSAAQGRATLNETLRMRSEIDAIYNMTRLMMLYASENASIARSMAEAAERSAAQGRATLNETLRIRDSIQRSSTSRATAAISSEELMAEDEGA